MATRPNARPQAKAAKAPVDTSGWEGVEAQDLADSGFGGGLVPADRYHVTINKAYFRESNSSGVSYVNLEMEIIEGEFANRYVFSPLYINSLKNDNFRKGQKGFLAKYFEICTGEIPDVFPETDDHLADLVGTDCGVEVIVEQNTDANGNLVDVNRVIRCFAWGADVAAQQTDAAEPRRTRAAASAPAPVPARAAAPSRTQQNPAAAPKQAGARAAPAKGTGKGRFDDLEDDIPF